MTTSINITDYVFRALPNGDNDWSHLALNTPVAITVDGAKEHNDHHTIGKMFAGAGLLAFALGTSGLGFGVVGSAGAFGIGAAELAMTGAAAGAFTGGALNKNLRSQGQGATFKNTRVLGMVGFVKHRSKHWANDDCKVVEVTWYVCDNNGVVRSENSWHLPEHLVSLESRAVAEERERKQREAEERARREALARKNKAQATVRQASKAAVNPNHERFTSIFVACILVFGLVGGLAAANHYQMPEAPSYSRIK